MAAVHPRFDLYIGDQRATRDPEALSRLRDERFSVRRENASPHKRNRKRNQESRRNRSELNELIGHVHLEQNSSYTVLKARIYLRY